MNKNLHFRTGRRRDADALVRQFHYSGRPPANVQIVGSLHEDGGLFGGDGNMVAACYFSIPPNPSWTEPVLELSRLVRAEEQVNLSRLVSLTVREIKKKRIWDLLISYADAAMDHHGGIYQACSWEYVGKRAKRIDGIVVNGSFFPNKSASSRFGTQSIIKLRKEYEDVFPHYDEGKHLYFKPINRRGKAKAKRLGLYTDEPYAKPAISALQVKAG